MVATKTRLRRHGVKSIWHGPDTRRTHVYTSQNTEGPSCAVLHGVGSNASTYAPLIKRLAPKTSRLWAPELLGHGFSDLPSPLPTTNELYESLRATLDDLIDEPVLLVGTSLGGAMALRYALDRPDSVHHLVLCSPAGAPMSESGWLELRQLFDIRSERDGVAFIERLLHRPRWFHRLGGRQVKEMLDRPLVRGLFDSAQPEDFFTADEVAQLKPKTLFIWGQSERILPRECLTWFKSHLPDHVIFDEPEGYGHSPHLETPKNLVQRILDFSGALDHPD